MRGLGYRLTDVLVIAACSLTFIAVVSPGRHEPKGPPIGLIAQDLGTTPEHFQELAEKIVPRRPPARRRPRPRRRSSPRPSTFPSSSWTTVDGEVPAARLHHR